MKHFKKSSGYAPVNDLSIHYEIHGEAKSNEIPLILLHGGGSGIETTFGGILPLLAKNRQIIAFDQQGHGRTADIDKRPFSFEQSADDAAELLKYLNIENADFFGFSNGGMITLQIAIRHPELVRKMIVASAASKRSGMPPEFWEGMKNITLEDMPEAFRESYQKISPHPEKLQSFFEKSSRRMQNFTDISDDEIRAINVPTMILVGDQDNILPEHTVELFRLLPNARLTILPSDHGGYLGEVSTDKEQSKISQATAAIVEEFLAGWTEN